MTRRQLAILILAGGIVLLLMIVASLIYLIWNLPPLNPAGFASQLLANIHYVMICVAIAMITYGFILLRKQIPRNEYRCSNCNYNLTGNTSGICPECGEGIQN